MTTAVIFDLYGTLLELCSDSRPFYELARRHSDGNMSSMLNLALTSVNRTLSDFAVRIGIQPQHDIPQLEVALRGDLARTKLFPDVIPTLNALKQRGVRIGVISNLATPYKGPFVDRGLNDLVDAAVFSCDRGITKPHPEIYKLALARLGAKPAETLMIGDSRKSDVDGPSHVGISALHLVRSDESSPAGTEIDIDRRRLGLHLTSQPIIVDVERETRQ